MTAYPIKQCMDGYSDHMVYVIFLLFPCYVIDFYVKLREANKVKMTSEASWLISLSKEPSYKDTGRTVKHGILTIFQTHINILKNSVSVDNKLLLPPLTKLLNYDC